MPRRNGRPRRRGRAAAPRNFFDDAEQWCCRRRHFQPAARGAVRPGPEPPPVFTLRPTPRAPRRPRPPRGGRPAADGRPGRGTIRPHGRRRGAGARGARRFRRLRAGDGRDRVRARDDAGRGRGDAAVRARVVRSTLRRRAGCRGLSRALRRVRLFFFGARACIAARETRPRAAVRHVRRRNLRPRQGACARGRCAGGRIAGRGRRGGFLHRAARPNGCR
mmetsp:Transcript_22390/g.69165  ORF Transcript_22390/g.69165 Transcript_22390/m.69165 type:complete len:220 (-) Transcript_22390:230-889(-)